MAEYYNYLYPDSFNIFCLTRIQLEYLSRVVFCLAGNNGLYAYKETIDRKRFIFQDPFTSHEITLLPKEVSAFGEYTIYVPINEVNVEFKPIQINTREYYYFPYGDPTFTGKNQISFTRAKVVLGDLVHVIFENTPYLFSEKKVWIYTSCNAVENTVTFQNYHDLNNPEESLTVSVDDIILIENKDLEININGTKQLLNLAGVTPMHFDCVKTQEDVDCLSEIVTC